MNSSINLKNHISLSSTNDIAHLCAPLSELLNLTYFCFQRIYDDGGRIYLNNYAEYIEHYLSNVSNGFYNGIAERHPSLYKSACILWDQIEGVPEIQLELKTAQENFNIAHGITITISCKNYVDVYHLGTNKENKNANNSYLSHMRIIEKFIYYFMVKARKLINKAEQHKIFLPLNSKAFFKPDNLGLQVNKKLDNFYNNLEIENLLIKIRDKDVLLSRRESECLFQLTLGKTTKEIARILDLSPRTIEFYINNIKEKTGSHTRAELVFSFAEDFRGSKICGEL